MVAVGERQLAVPPPLGAAVSGPLSVAARQARSLPARVAAEGDLLWLHGGALHGGALDSGTLAILDPHLAQRVSATNFADLTLPGHRLTGWLRPQRGAPVSWTAVRSAWLAQLRDPAFTRPLGARMADAFGAVAGTETDLVELAHRASIRALLPVVADGLTGRDARRVLDFVAIRASEQFPAGPPAQYRFAWRTTATHWPVAASLHRELHARAAGRRPRRADLLDPLAGELLRDLGCYQATDSMLALLTALCGPPGATAAGLLYELARHPQWAGRLARELAPLDAEQLGGPSRATPLTWRFIKEVLRVWTPQAFIERQVRTPITLAGATLTTRNDYVLSPYLLHRDPRYWQDPETFDPDRWRPGAAGAPATGASYMPFGWPPRACVGARLALAHLMALCHLMCTRYRIELAKPEAITVTLHSGPVPVNFRGRIVPRPHVPSSSAGTTS